jgi:hypothetical protein
MNDGLYHNFGDRHCHQPLTAYSDDPEKLIVSSLADIMFTSSM